MNDFYGQVLLFITAGLEHYAVTFAVNAQLCCRLSDAERGGRRAEPM